MFQIFTLYLNFEGAKNIHVLQVFILGSEGHWRFLTVVRQLYPNLDTITGFLYVHVIEGAKNIHAL